MQIKITPPSDFDFNRSYRHLKQVIRTRSRRCILKRKHNECFTVSGPVPDLVMLKIALTGYEYDVER